MSLSTKLGVKSDDLLFCYELSVFPSVSESILDTVGHNSVLKTVTLPSLAVAPNRFDPAGKHNNPLNLIWQTPRGMQAIDAFAILEDNSFLLIQYMYQYEHLTIQEKCSQLK